MDMNTMNTSQMMKVGNDVIKVEYDVQAQMDTEQTAFMMSQGLISRSFLDIINNIRDTRDIVILLMQGVNGANRVEGINKRLSFEESAKIFDTHMQWIGQTAKTNDEMLKLFNEFKTDIRNAGLKGLHLDFLVSPTA